MSPCTLIRSSPASTCRSTIALASASESTASISVALLRHQRPSAGFSRGEPPIDAGLAGHQPRIVGDQLAPERGDVGVVLRQHGVDLLLGVPPPDLELLGQEPKDHQPLLAARRDLHEPPVPHERGQHLPIVGVVLRVRGERGDARVGQAIAGERVQRVAVEGVSPRGALGGHPHQTELLQLSEVVRHRRRAELHRRGQLLHRRLADREDPDQPKPAFIRQHLEERQHAIAVHLRLLRPSSM